LLLCEPRTNDGTGTCLALCRLVLGVRSEGRCKFAFLERVVNRFLSGIHPIGFWEGRALVSPGFNPMKSIVVERSKACKVHSRL
jgi:hypothetical protein